MVYRYARMIGVVLTAIGLAVLISFSYYAFGRVTELRKAQLYQQRNPGNAMYDAQLFVAASQLGFVIGGAITGLLIALNGFTWIALGSAVQRLEHGGRST